MDSSYISSSKILIISSAALVLISCASISLGEITCEQLDQSTCAYAIASSGMRCVLEKRVLRGGKAKYVCGASDIVADGIKDWIETDKCIEACGLDRSTLGISSDALLDSSFTENLCSTRCTIGCPNVIDLYFNLAAAEGVFLPKLCEEQRANPRRAMTEIRSSSVVAALGAVPVPGAVFVAGPTSTYPPAESPMPGAVIVEGPTSSPAESPM